VLGGILIGIAIGYAFIIVHKKILNNSIVSTSLSLLTPFVAYLAAEIFHASGVLSVVCSGLVISWRAPDVFSYQTRIRHKAVWDTIIFLLNGFVFILIGLQLQSILADLKQYSLSQLLLYGFIVSIVTILVRVFSVFGAASLQAIILKQQNKSEDLPDRKTWKNVMIVAWTGTRGVVSLATALALPFTVAGTAFPQRSLILFLAFVVIFVTLVIQGLSLPLLLRILKVADQNTNEGDERELRLSIANKVLSFIDEDLSDRISQVTRNRIRIKYIEMIASLSEKRKKPGSGSAPTIESSAADELTKAQSAINKFQRSLLIGYHQTGTFKQDAIREFERKLDLEELLLKKKN
jgi:CPA1 family monovalent cation:H+ antiporter